MPETTTEPVVQTEQTGNQLTQDDVAELARLRSEKAAKDAKDAELKALDEVLKANGVNQKGKLLFNELGLNSQSVKGFIEKNKGKDEFKDLFTIASPITPNGEGKVIPAKVETDQTKAADTNKAGPRMGTRAWYENQYK